MSHINAYGDVAHGVAGGNASVNNVVFSPGAVGGWLDDNRVFFANGSAGWALYIYDRITKTIVPAITDTSDPQYGQGGNSLFARDGVWAAWLGGSDSHRGLYSNTGMRLPDGGLMGVGGGGAIGFKPLYQSFGPTLVRETNGDEWKITDGHAYELVLLGNHTAIWQEANQLRVFGLPQPMQIGNAWRPFAFVRNGEWWVSYWSDVCGYITHPFNSPIGYQIVPAGVDSWVSARQINNDWVLFALHPSEAEQSFTPYHLRFDQPAVNLTPSVVAPKLTGSCWLGWYEFAQGRQGPGNCTLAVRNITSVDRPVIVTDETLNISAPKVLGHFIGGDDVDKIEFSASQTKYRPIAYWDDRNWPRWPVLPKGAWTCVQAYCRLDESPLTFEKDIRRILDSSPLDAKIALVCQQYTSNAKFTRDLTSLIPVFIRLRNDYSQKVVALLLFNGYGRATGISDHSEIVPYWTEATKSVGVPSIEKYPVVIDPPPPPPPGKKKPPVPVPFYPSLKPYEVNMDSKVVAIQAFAGKFGRILAAESGKGPFGWYPVVFDRDTPDDDCKFDLTKPDDKFKAKHQKTGALLGLDATKFSASLTTQFYGKPNDDRGGYESLSLYKTPSGMIIGFIEYNNTEGKYPSCAFSVVEL
jgi:hypothetical protein